jgi:hypothetical protein
MGLDTRGPTKLFQFYVYGFGVPIGRIASGLVSSY